MLPGYPWLNQSRCIDSEVYASGWKALIGRLLDDIDSILDGSDATLVVLQVKEKFGVLRFYYQLVDGTADQQAEIEALVRCSADESRRTCFDCGRAAEMRKVNGWIVPLCDLHARRTRNNED